MSFLKSLPPEAALLHIFQAFPTSARPLLEYLEVVLRGESPLSAGEREVIAAYVSALNNCNYCRTIHADAAVLLGANSQLVENLLSSKQASDADDRMRPILQLAHKLTVSPGHVNAADIAAVFAAGWDDRALHDAVAVCSLFNFINRFVNGLGVEAPDWYMKRAAKELTQNGYANLIKRLPQQTADHSASSSAG
ncbi:MAG TPA: peroxidase-related enzyme [Chthoniobacterales bacterium]|jgi:uncharacterized peroxidase-related enzyme